MKNIFSGSEIVELGIQIEKNGSDFYDILSKRSKNQATAEIFDFLAKEEEKHIEVFRGILEKLQIYVPPVYAEEYFAYMNALAGEYVFTQKDQGKEIAKKITSDKEAVEMGIGLEKDSIIFYEGIKEMVPGHDKAIVDKLIEEERKHFRRLSDLKKEIGGN